MDETIKKDVIARAMTEMECYAECYPVIQEDVAIYSVSKTKMTVFKNNGKIGGYPYRSLYFIGSRNNRFASTAPYGLCYKRGNILTSALDKEFRIHICSFLFI